MDTGEVIESSPIKDFFLCRDPDDDYVASATGGGLMCLKWHVGGPISRQEMRSVVPTQAMSMTKALRALTKTQSTRRGRRRRARQRGRL
jgi:hypothetical protein